MLNYMDLVPSLSMCKRIKGDGFGNSRFVWYVGKHPFIQEAIVTTRSAEDVNWKDGIYPAPTMHEMFYSLQQSKVAIKEVSCRFLGNGQKVVICKYDTDKVAGLEISLAGGKVEDILLRIWMSFCIQEDTK